MLALDVDLVLTKQYLKNQFPFSFVIGIYLGESPIHRKLDGK